jgi:hypothetical protein
MTDHKSERNCVKRGILNVIGEVSKVLFGTMDDACIMGKVNALNKNENSLTYLMKEEVYVVKSPLGTRHETL